MLETKRLRQRPENRAISQVRCAGDEGQAQLLINQQHGFFFDHPHDHIPGLLLLESGHQLAVELLPEGAWFASELQAGFVKYCLFDSPVELRAQRHPVGDGWVCDVTVTQQQEARATLHWAFIPLPKERLVHRQPTVDAPIDKALVNKQRPENVMIGKPYALGPNGHQCHALVPDPDNLLADSRGQTHPLYLLEAFMQLQRSLNHAESVRLRDILLGVSMTQRLPLDVRSAFYMQTDRQSEKDEGRHFSRGAELWADGQCFARCDMHTGRIRRVKSRSEQGKETV